jgi:glucosylceramidase
LKVYYYFIIRLILLQILKGEQIIMASSGKRRIMVVQSAENTQDRLTRKEDDFFAADDGEGENSFVNVYHDILDKEIEGFGGAFTEAAANALDRMSLDRRSEILEKCFDPDKGIGLSLCRTHINSCDFCLSNYSYDDVDHDIDLKSFSIERDKKSLIPFILDAMKANGANFKLIASPWSPPPWMKTNGEMNNGGKLKKEYWDVWARYYAKYLKAYADEGVDIWGVTVQNEPNAVQTWDSCIYTAEEERDFVRDYLGPVLAKEGLSDVKVMIWDHNKERIYERSKIAYADPEAAKYIWGSAFHHYSGYHFEALDIFHEAFPDKAMISSENGSLPGLQIGQWYPGEVMAYGIFGDMNHFSSGWIFWNIILDEMGGPVHDGNYCDALLIADTKKDEIIYESLYYYLGHFSKFIRPGAKRVGFSRFTDKLEITSFKNPNGKIAVVIMNRNDYDIKYKLRCEYGLASFVSLPHSIMTLVY